MVYCVGDRLEVPALVDRDRRLVGSDLKFLADDLGVVPRELASAAARLAHDLAIRDPEVEELSRRVRKREPGTRPDA